MYKAIKNNKTIIITGDVPQAVKESIECAGYKECKNV